MKLVYRKFFVRVVCEAYSGHRDPTGVYAVEVRSERPLHLMACAALAQVQERAPFMAENLHRTICEVFDTEGNLITIPHFADSDAGKYVCFHGRVTDHPHLMSQYD